MVTNHQLARMKWLTDLNVIFDCWKPHNAMHHDPIHQIRRSLNSNKIYQGKPVIKANEAFN